MANITLPTNVNNPNSSGYIPTNIYLQAAQAAGVTNGTNTQPAYTGAGQNAVNNWFATNAGKAWLASKGYQVVTTGGDVVGGTTISDPTTMAEGEPYTFTRNGTSLTRYIVKDYYGNTMLSQTTDPSTVDFIWYQGAPHLFQQQTGYDPTTMAQNTYWTSPDFPNKKFQDYDSTWVDTTSTTGSTTGELTGQALADYNQTVANTRLTNAEADQLLQTLNDPAASDNDKNNAAIQLYGYLLSYANNNNSNAISQWGNQAGAFNQAYGNAIEQNKWLQDMSTSPLNTVAYLNLIRGQNPPNWNLPNYQQMPDAFTGWNQVVPTTQATPTTAEIQSLLAGLWGNNTTPTTTPTTGAWANGVTDPNQNQYSAARAAYPTMSEADLNKYYAPLTTEQQAQSQASYNAGVSPETATQLSNMIAARTPTPPTTAQSSNWNLIQSDIERMRRLAALAK